MLRCRFIARYIIYYVYIVYMHMLLRVSLAFSKHIFQCAVATRMEEIPVFIEQSYSIH